MCTENQYFDAIMQLHQQMMHKNRNTGTQHIYKPPVIQRRQCWNFRKLFSSQKTRMTGLPCVEEFRQYVQPLWHNTVAWDTQTERTLAALKEEKETLMFLAGLSKSTTQTWDNRQKSNLTSYQMEPRRQWSQTEVSVGRWSTTRLVDSFSCRDESVQRSDRCGRHIDFSVS